MPSRIMKEGYTVKGPVNTPNQTANIGKPKAFSFNYGTVRSKIYGEARVVGRILSFEPFYDKEALLSTDTFTISKLIDLAYSIREEMKSLGITENEITRESASGGLGGLFKNDFVTILNLLFPCKTMEESKPFILALASLALIDDSIDEAIEEGRNLEPILSACSAAIKGELTHLDQIQLPSTFKRLLAHLILLRKEALACPSAESWPFLERELLEFLQAVSKEHTKDYSSLEEYLDFRPYSVASGVAIESVWMVLGLHVPENVRHDSDFLSFKHLMCLYTGLQNDVTGLKKEIDAGEENNVVLIIAGSDETVEFQGALDESLKIMEGIYFKIKTKVRNLLMTFRENLTVEQILAATFRLVDYQLLVQEILKERYGFEGLSSSYDIIEFNQAYIQKEIQLESFLTDSKRSHHLTENDLVIMDGLKKLNKQQETKPIKPKDQVDDGVLQRKPLPGVIQLTSTPESLAPPKPLDVTKIPKHLAIIPDGNRRWAKNKGLNPWNGHEEGGNLVMHVLVPAIWDQGVHTVTVWFISPENFQRPKLELEVLWELLENILKVSRPLCEKFEARFCHIGNRDRMRPKLLKIIQELEEETKLRTGRCLNLAMDYGGIDEIVQAVRRTKGPHELISSADISKNLFADSTDQLYPQPDLIVRTGTKDAKTVRMSGFMAWQSTYAELLFVDNYLPDTKVEDVDEWLRDFAGAERRFGK